MTDVTAFPLVSLVACSQGPTSVKWRPEVTEPDRAVAQRTAIRLTGRRPDGPGVWAVAIERDGATLLDGRTRWATPHAVGDRVYTASAAARSPADTPTPG